MTYFQRRHHLPHRELRLVALSLSCEAGLALLSLSSTFVSAAVGLVRRELRSSLPVACKGRAWLPRTARSITWLENSRRAALSARSPCGAGQRHADREVRARPAVLPGRRPLEITPHASRRASRGRLRAVAPFNPSSLTRSAVHRAAGICGCRAASDRSGLGLLKPFHRFPQLMRRVACSRFRVQPRLQAPAARQAQPLSRLGTSQLIRSFASLSSEWRLPSAPDQTEDRGGAHERCAGTLSMRRSRRRTHSFSSFTRLLVELSSTCCTDSPPWPPSRRRSKSPLPSRLSRLAPTHPSLLPSLTLGMRATRAP